MDNFSKGIIVSDVDSIIKYINEIKKILVEDGDIEEMLELVFSNEKHYNNILKFLNGQISD